MTLNQAKAYEPTRLLAYSHAYNSGWTDWIAHRVVSAVIHAVIYGAVFKLMRQMTTGEAIILAAVVIGRLLMWSRSRDRRGW